MRRKKPVLFVADRTNETVGPLVVATDITGDQFPAPLRSGADSIRNGTAVTGQEKIRPPAALAIERRGPGAVRT